MLEDVKLLLGIDCDDRDDLLNLLINTASIQLLNKLKVIGDIKIIPEELRYIVIELVIIRFNKIGSEGIQTENVEGYTATYTSTELSQYNDEIQSYIDNQQGKSKERVVRFL